MGGDTGTFNSQQIHKSKKAMIQSESEIHVPPDMEATNVEAHALVSLQKDVSRQLQTAYLKQDHTFIPTEHVGRERTLFEDVTFSRRFN